MGAPPIWVSVSLQWNRGTASGPIRVERRNRERKRERERVNWQNSSQGKYTSSMITHHLIHFYPFRQLSYSIIYKSYHKSFLFLFGSALINVVIKKNKQGGTGETPCKKVVLNELQYLYLGMKAAPLCLPLSLPIKKN